MSVVYGHAPGTPSWFDLMSTNLSAARSFYKSVFGWDYLDLGPELGNYSIALKGGHPVAGLGPQMPGAPAMSAWSVYFATEDLGASLSAVEENGGKVLVPPMEVPGQGHMGVFMDPTGAAFGFWQPDAHRGAELTNEHGAMAWAEVNTRQGEAATAFYSAVLGLEARPMPGGMAYWTLHHGEEAVCGVMQMNEQWPADLPPHWMPYFAVDNTDATLKEVRAYGGAIRVPAFDTPYGRISVVADSTGGTFSIIQLKAQTAS